jgi:hypothetical protein
VRSLRAGHRAYYDEFPKTDMPRITLRAAESLGGKEDTLTEYICDWPDCPNVAEHVLGVVAELRVMAAVCSEHARLLAARSKR